MVNRKVLLAISLIMAAIFTAGFAQRFYGQVSAAPEIDKNVETVVILQSFAFGGTNGRAIITWDKDGVENRGTAHFSFAFCPKGLINVTKVQLDATLRHEYNDSSYMWIGFNEMSNGNITQDLYHKDGAKVDMHQEAVNYVFSSTDTAVCSGLRYGINELRISQISPSTDGGYKMWIFRLVLNVEYYYFRD